MLTSSASPAVAVAAHLLAPHDHETFAILFLDNRHRVIEFVPLFRGTVDGASVYPREVVKEALHRNAAAVILAHNHPSGVAEPSQADELITTRVRDALSLVDIRVLDHLGGTNAAIVSLAERGLPCGGTCRWDFDDDRLQHFFQFAEESWRLYPIEDVLTAAPVGFLVLGSSVHSNPFTISSIVCFQIRKFISRFASVTPPCSRIGVWTMRSPSSSTLAFTPTKF